MACFIFLLDLDTCRLHHNPYSLYNSGLISSLVPSNLYQVNPVNCAELLCLILNCVWPPVEQRFWVKTFFLIQIIFLFIRFRYLVWLCWVVKRDSICCKSSILCWIFLVIQLLISNVILIVCYELRFTSICFHAQNFY